MTVNVQNVLKQFDIDPRLGVNRVIQEVGQQINEATDPLGYANAIVIAFGGAEQLDFPTARIMAKSLVEQAISGNKFEVDTALKIAEEKVAKLRKDQNWLFKSEEPSAESTKPVKAKGRKSARMADGQSKKSLALKMCEANSSLENGAIAGLIAKELSITYANAYYYVSRVWKRPASN